MFQESKKELIGLIFTILTVLAVSYLNDPDSVKTTKMYLADRLKRAANRTAFAALDIADFAQNKYDEECHG